MDQPKSSNSSTTRSTIDLCLSHFQIKRQRLRCQVSLRKDPVKRLYFNPLYCLGFFIQSQIGAP